MFMEDVAGCTPVFMGPMSCWKCVFVKNMGVCGGRELLRYGFMGDMLVLWVGGGHGFVESTNLLGDLGG